MCMQHLQWCARVGTDFRFAYSTHMEFGNVSWLVHLTGFLYFCFQRIVEKVKKEIEELFVLLTNPIMHVKKWPLM